MTRRRVLAGLLAMAAVFLAGCTTDGGFQFVNSPGQTKYEYSPDQRGKVPEVSGESLLEPDKTIKTSDFAGKVIVLNVWGSWCAPCRGEADVLEKVYRETKDSGVQFLGVDIRDHLRSEPTDFVRDRKLTYPSIYDPPGKSLLPLKGVPIVSPPVTVVLDRQHQVSAIFLGAVRESELAPVVQRLAAEPAPTPNK